ncbi:ABC transporter permease [Streptosporangium sp. NPDC023615]|uniref:ABC transporter permease n=1 Tax=Streptosporangium sp. NPDC023615 TaxID=3154794 RepID=UPI00344455F7
MSVTTPAPVPPAPAPSGGSSPARVTRATRAAWVAADSWTIALRDLRHWVRRPGPVVVGWFFPVLTVLMFGGLFGGAIGGPGGSSGGSGTGDYIDFLVPGMFAMAMLFGLESTMTAVTTDASRGVTDRFRSMPMNSSVVVMGRGIADMLDSAVGLAVLFAAGLLLGWRAEGGPAGTLAAVGLLLLLRFALLWVGIFIGLVAGGPEAVTSVQILVWPAGFLSGVFVDPATMPSWLGAVAEWNPLSATATAVRGFFGDPGRVGESWVAQHAATMAVLWPLLLIAVFLPLSARTFRRLGD